MDVVFRLTSKHLDRIRITAHQQLNQFIEGVNCRIGSFIDALLKVQTAMDAKEFGMRAWLPLMITALFLTGAAIAILVLQTKFADTHVLIPVALMLDGAESFWNTLGTVRIRAKKEGRYEELLDSKELDFTWRK